MRGLECLGVPHSSTEGRRFAMIWIWRCEHKVINWSQCRLQQTFLALDDRDVQSEVFAASTKKRLSLEAKTDTDSLEEPDR